jgi:hypothetical protein
MRAVILSAALTAVLGAQQPLVRPFQPSPAASVSQDLGICNVKIDYSRPGVKGRKIWGGLVPYGEVWRAGANAATVITFSHPVKIAGKDLAAGSYAFFAIPGEKAWTLILSGNAKQWGAEDYKPSEDVLRFQATPEALPGSQEWLAYDVQVKAPDAVRVELSWEKLKVGFDVALDAPAVYWAYLEKTLGGQGAPFASGARYCLNSGTHLDKGLEWADLSIKVKETYANLEVKAKLLQKLGRTGEALPLLGRAIELAKAAGTPEDYVAGLEKTRAQWSGK